jgi:N utilization substance protein B
MLPRTFAREIAFQVIYRDDLNPPAAAPDQPADDRAADPLAAGRELREFVARLAEIEDPDDAGRQHERERLRSPEMVEFTRSLVAGVRQHRPDIDQRIAPAAANWSLERMAATDRNLLRLGAYEILFTDTPGKVAIDEAIDLAKRFGGAQSAQFVNGILDNLLHQNQSSGRVEPEQAPPESATKATIACPHPNPLPDGEGTGN